MSRWFAGSGSSLTRLGVHAKASPPLPAAAIVLSMIIVAAAVHALAYGSWYMKARATYRFFDQVDVALAAPGATSATTSNAPRIGPSERRSARPTSGRCKPCHRVRVGGRSRTSGVIGLPRVAGRAGLPAWSTDHTRRTQPVHGSHGAARPPDRGGARRPHPRRHALRRGPPGTMQAQVSAGEPACRRPTSSASPGRVPPRPSGSSTRMTTCSSTRRRCRAWTSPTPTAPSRRPARARPAGSRRSSR